LTLEEIVRDRSKMTKLLWIGLISSFVFIAIGIVVIIMAVI
jgi:flagellar basal body-associated protein FliL